MSSASKDLYGWIIHPTHVQKGENTTTKIALISVLTALCLALQLAPRPPNVEFTSLLTFVVGAVFGSFMGVSFGCFIMFVNGFLSPWGFAGLNMPFQMVGMGLVGLVGGLYRGYMHDRSRFVSFMEVAVLGAFLTVVYDLITNFGVAILPMISGVPPTLALLTVLASGAPFSLVHVCSNTLAFGLIFIPLARTLSQIPVVKKFG
ncbi:MAG: ECF transporter S component [Candidatus Bathyarchaeia archaeon]